MKVIAFYTSGPYTEEAVRLQASLERVGMDHYIAMIAKPAANWNEAVALKPKFIAECISRFGGKLLYVDVDAFVHINCTDYFEQLDCDFAAHWFQGPSGGQNRARNDNHFLSGTMLFNNTKKTSLLLEAWMVRNKEKQERGDWEGGGQLNLKEVLEEDVVRHLQVQRLPGRYCYVFDKPWAYPPDEPCIIEHTIASRENRGKSKGKINFHRRQRLRLLDKVLQMEEE